MDIPSLPHFSLMYRSLAMKFRAACQVIKNMKLLFCANIPLGSQGEYDPVTTGLYIRFLCNTCPAASLDMVTVTVERFSLLPTKLPGSRRVSVYI